MREVFSNVNDINLFLIFPRMSLHFKLVPVQYRVCDKRQPVRESHRVLEHTMHVHVLGIGLELQLATKANAESLFKRK